MKPAEYRQRIAELGLTRATLYGFEFGPALVERLVQHKGYVVVGVKTQRQRLDITVTPSRLIRVGKPVQNLAPKVES